MIECRRRQTENYKGSERHRCLNPEAEPFREVVVEPQCSACPVRQMLDKRPPCNPNPQPCTSCGDSAQAVPTPTPKSQSIDTTGFELLCPYREFTEGGPMCQVTGLPVTPEICGRCDEDAREATATLSDKMFNFSSAIRKWVAKGRPTRTDEEVEQILNEHCRKCDRYDPVKHVCKACGCIAKTGGSPLTNKLKMKTESCPLGRFV